MKMNKIRSEEPADYTTAIDFQLQARTLYSDNEAIAEAIRILESRSRASDIESARTGGLAKISIRCGRTSYVFSLGLPYFWRRFSPARPISVSCLLLALNWFQLFQAISS